jgi:hypothetical protein
MAETLLKLNACKTKADKGGRTPECAKLFTRWRQQKKWENNLRFKISELRFPGIVAGWMGSRRQR